MLQLRTAILGGMLLFASGIMTSMLFVRWKPLSRGADVVAPVVSAAPVLIEEPRRTQEFVGVVVARLSAEVSPRFSGKLRQVSVRLGDRVAKGDVLALLDLPSVRSDLRSAEATLLSGNIERERAKVELSEAEEQLRRRTALAAETLATGEDLAAAQYRHKLAGVRVEATQAAVTEKRVRVEQLAKDVGDEQIRAPFDGIIAARYLDPGSNVTSSTPIVRLISDNDLLVRFAAPEEQALRLSVGGFVRVRLGEGRAPLRAVIAKVAPEIDAASRMIVAEATFSPSNLPSKESVPLVAGVVAHVSLYEER